MYTRSEHELKTELEDGGGAGNPHHNVIEGTLSEREDFACGRSDQGGGGAGGAGAISLVVVHFELICILSCIFGACLVSLAEQAARRVNALAIERDTYQDKARARLDERKGIKLMNFALKMMDFVLKMINFALKMMNCVLTMMNVYYN